MLNRKRGRMLEGRKGKTRCNYGAMSRIFTTVIWRDKIMNKSLDHRYQVQLSPRQ
jgi:hypothetical protein